MKRRRKSAKVIPPAAGIDASSCRTACSPAHVKPARTSHTAEGDDRGCDGWILRPASCPHVQSMPKQHEASCMHQAPWTNPMLTRLRAAGPKPQRHPPAERQAGCSRGAPRAACGTGSACAGR